MSALAATGADFSVFTKLASEGKVANAYEKLQKQSDDGAPPQQLYLKYFALGSWAFELKKWSEARTHLAAALKLGDTNSHHIHYLIGHSWKEEGQLREAEESFQKALKLNPPQNIVFQSRFELSELAVLANSYKKAREHLVYLEKRWRGTPQYPEVLWRLIGVELNDNRRHLACRWARTLYSRQPAHELVAQWGVHLQNNKYGIQTLGCMASAKDTNERMRRLALSGQAQKARAEIDILRKEARPSEKQTYDMLMARHLESQGYPEEAMQILAPYFETNRSNYNYLSLLAKISARASEYATAIGAYYRAYQLSPRSKSGKEALFTAAFLSYQIQDYDGAHSKFTELIKKFSGSGLARDSRWHLAWIRYLKSDFVGAEKSFRALMNEKYYARRRRVVRPFANDRTQYWFAMTLMRQGKNEEARTVFERLAKAKDFSYYSFVAQNRVAQIPKAVTKRNVALAEGAKAAKEGEEADLTATGEGQANLAIGDIDKVKAESEESEENLSVDATDEPEDSAVDAGAGDAGPVLKAGDGEVAEEGEPDEEKEQFVLSDQKLQERLDSARNLIQIGQKDWAKWELFEIERRTSNKKYLRSLMEEYVKIGSYNRASFISETRFGGERVRLGLKDGRELWSFHFPRAYSSYVENYSKQFGAPSELVYAIMRAESHFNKDALSPVGARGLMQIMPYTAHQLVRLLNEPPVSDLDLHKPDVGIRLGTRYLSRLQKEFQSQITLVAAGYNAGPHRVNNWLNSFGHLDMDEFIEHVPFVETRNYMKKVARNYAMYQKIYSSKPISYQWLTDPVVKASDATHSTRENWDSLE